MTSLIVRDFEENDRDAVIRLWERCGLTRSWNDPYADIDLAMAAPNATLLVGLLDSDLITSLMVGFDGHRGWVYYLAVAPEEQRRGCGRLMMNVAEDWLRARDAPKIQLMVRDDNRAAIRFYEALGYEVQKTTTLGKRLDRYGFI